MVIKNGSGYMYSLSINYKENYMLISRFISEKLPNSSELNYDHPEDLKDGHIWSEIWLF
jgi:hypothetical protein